MQRSDRLWIREIVSANDPTLEPCKTLFYAAFPPDERVPGQSFAHMLERRASGKENYESQPRLVVAQLGDEFAGFCSFGCLVDMKADPLEHFGAIYYMAVVPELRSRGIGQFLFKTVEAIVTTDARCRRANPRGVLLEVESPDQAADPADRTVREHRIKFYERLGCRLLKRIDYVQPPLEAGRNPLHLHLMAGGEVTSRSDRHICRLWYRLIFQLDESDPMVVAATTPTG